MTLIREVPGVRFDDIDEYGDVFSVRIMIPSPRGADGFIWTHMKDRATLATAGDPPTLILKETAGARLDYWLVGDRVYVTRDLRLTPEDVKALANESENRRRLALQKAHTLQAMSDDLKSSVRRQPIPQAVKVEVWQRDRGRCAECDGNESLEFDHIIPLAMGGSNTTRNLQLLCEACNRRKGASLG